MPCLLSLNDLDEREMDLFREWDRDGNGEISREEFRIALHMLGLQATPDQVSESSTHKPHPTTTTLTSPHLT